MNVQAGVLHCLGINLWFLDVALIHLVDDSPAAYVVVFYDGCDIH